MRPLFAAGVVALVFALLLPMSAEADEPPGPARESGPIEVGKWQVLFDGKTLGKWKVIDAFDFQRHGKVYVKEGRLVLSKGKPLTGVKWTGKLPRIDYEVALDAMRVEGDDFFCSMVFPVGKQDCSVTFGGWGGSTVGLTNIDGEPAVENETCVDRDFKDNHWYRLRFRVTAKKIEVWIDKEKVVDFTHPGRKLTIRWEQEPMLPFGISSYRTTAAMKNITVRPIVAGQRGEAPPKAPAGKPQLAPVTGLVTLDGKPVAGGTVLLLPKERRPALGHTDRNGRFTLSTFEEGDGALPGTYRVAIILIREREGKTEWIVPKKYADPKTSGLSVEVRPGENRFDFDLISH